MDMKLKPAAVFIALAGMVSLALITPAFAEWDEQCMETQHKHGGKQDIMAKLNLSPEQKDQITKQRDMNKEKRNGLKDKMRAKRLELKQELEKPEIDKNKIDAIVGDIKTMTGQQLELSVDNILAMKQILTPEQFKKLQEMKESKHRKDKKAGAWKKHSRKEKINQQ